MDPTNTEQALIDALRKIATGDVPHHYGYTGCACSKVAHEVLATFGKTCSTCANFDHTEPCATGSCDALDMRFAPDFYCAYWTAPKQQERK